MNVGDALIRCLGREPRSRRRSVAAMVVWSGVAVPLLALSVAMDDHWIRVVWAFGAVVALTRALVLAFGPPPPA